uniref:PUM-HD domain-containing protein n=1 Tax=Kalanchoe fedtschenkoi TaxID=63787 RepID=A0A7N0UQ60_KALFE
METDSDPNPNGVASVVQLSSGKPDTEVDALTMNDTDDPPSLPGQNLVSQSDSDEFLTPFVSSFLSDDLSPVNGFSSEPCSASGALQRSTVDGTPFAGDIFAWGNPSEGEVVAVQPSDDGTSVAVLRQLPPKPMTAEETSIHAYGYGPPQDFILTYYSTTPGSQSSTAPAQNSIFNNLGAAALSYDPCMNQNQIPGALIFHNPPAGHTITALTSPYASAGSGVEGIGAMMNGLRLGTPSSSISELAAPYASFNSPVGVMGGAPSIQMSPHEEGAGHIMGGTGMSVGDSSSLTDNSNADRFFCVHGLNKFVLGLAKTDGGARYLMAVMGDKNQADIDVIIEAVMTDVFGVMTDEPGLKLFRRLLDICSRTQKDLLFSRIIADPVQVIFCSLNSHGSRALISLIDHVKGSHGVQQLATILAMEIGTLLLDHQAGRVIGHCLIHLNAEQCEPLYEALIYCALSLAVHTHGCSWLYTVIDNIKGLHRTRLLNVLADNSVQLAGHRSGNYVVTYLLDLRDYRVTMKICSLLLGHYTHLATDKRGSHVVEKCIQTPGIRFVMDEFLNLTSTELERIACHEFGNYVIKTALTITEITCAPTSPGNGENQARENVLQKTEELRKLWKMKSSRSGEVSR